MKFALSLGSLAAALVLSSVLVSAQNQDGPGKRPDFRTQRDDLGLTDAQKTDLRKAREATQRENLRRTTDLRIAKLDLKGLLREEKVDEKAVAARLAEASAAQSALLKLRVDSVLAMKRILTPEQQRKVAQMRAERGAERMSRRMRRRGDRMRGMPGPVRGRTGMGPARPGDDLDLDLDLDESENDRDEIEIGNLVGAGAR